MKKSQKKHKTVLRARRHRRIRGAIQGTKDRPRLSVFRSAKHLILQLIDDENGKTLVALTDNAQKGKKGGTKTEMAKIAGKTLAQAALGKGIKKVVFDRGGYAYHGRVRAAADGAREGGLVF